MGLNIVRAMGYQRRYVLQIGVLLFSGISGEFGRVWEILQELFLQLLLSWAMFALVLPALSYGEQDSRSIFNGTVMLVRAYLDQPYCKIDAKCGWVCVITADAEHEGGAGEDVLVIRSDDGKVWDKYVPVKVEPNTSLTNAYANMAYSAEHGRFFAVYNFNLYNVTTYPDGRPLSRTDGVGVFAMRWSDDCGATWSSDRAVLPYRQTWIDKTNSYNGSVDMFWTVDPVRGRAPGVGVEAPEFAFAFTKIGTAIYEPPEEVFVIGSWDLYNVSNPLNATFELLPSGDHGFAPPGGNPSINEEGHVVPLAAAEGGGHYMVARTTQGYLAATETKDPSMRTGWTTSHFAQFWVVTPSGASYPPIMYNASKTGPNSLILKNPRGPITPKRFIELSESNSNAADVLMVFYFNSYTSFSGNSRNPYFLVAGHVMQGTMYWSQPEIILYDYFSEADRPGYPDLLWDASESTIAMTETNKTYARLHWFDRDIVNGVISQHTINEEATSDLIFKVGSGTPTHAIPHLSMNSSTYFSGDGFTIEMWISEHSKSKAGETLVNADNSTNPKRGFSVTTHVDGSSLEIYIVDDTSIMSVEMDPLCGSYLAANDGIHQVAAIVDAGAHITLWIVDGMVCDGGSTTERGWAWFSTEIQDLNGPGEAKFAYNYGGSFHGARLYDRALRVSELVGNFRAGIN